MHTLLHKPSENLDFEAPGPGVKRKAHPPEHRTPASVHVLLRWVYHLDRSPSEIGAKKKKKDISASEKHSPDNQYQVSQASVALFSAGCLLLPGLEMCFLWATSTRWKDDSLLLPHLSPIPGSHRLQGQTRADRSLHLCLFHIHPSTFPNVKEENGVVTVLFLPNGSSLRESSKASFQCPIWG